MEGLPKEVLWIIFENALMQVSIFHGRKSLYNVWFSIFSVTGRLTTDLKCVCRTFRSVILRNSVCQGRGIRGALKPAIKFIERDYITRHVIVVTFYHVEYWPPGDIKEWEDFRREWNGKVTRRTLVIVRPKRELIAPRKWSKLSYSLCVDGKEQLGEGDLPQECRNAAHFSALVEKYAK